VNTVMIGRGQGQADPQKLSWMLWKVIEAFDRRDGAAYEGWLARLRFEFGPLPFSTTAEVNAAIVNAGKLVDLQDPYWLLQQAIEAFDRYDLILVNSWLVRIYRLFGCPPIECEEEMIETMELAGFGLLVQGLVDTGLDLPRTDQGEG
jgi:hypothetical protein